MEDKMVLCLVRWLFRLTEHPRNKTYIYGYQVHPFDEGKSRFQVQASSLEEADALAQEAFADLVEKRQTVMRQFFLVSS